MSPSLLLILTEFPPSYGGMQTHAVELCRYLHGRGYRIEVATYRGTRGPAAMEDLPFPVHRCLSRISYRANIRRLCGLAGKAGAHLIYSSTVYFGEVGRRLGIPMFCRSAGNDVLRPWIAWPFEIGSGCFDLEFFETHVYPRLKDWDWPDRCEMLLWKQRREAMRRSVQSMSKVFANSRFTQELLRAEGVDETRIEVLPGGVNASAFAPGKQGKAALRERLKLDASTYYLIAACRLVRKKGLDTLIEALALLRRDGAGVELLIAGDGREREACERRAVELGVAGALRLLGYLPQTALKDYFQAADAFVLSSREVVNPHSGLRDAETMGRVLCEANASGLPVVATRSGGIPSVIEDGVNGLLADENSPEALAAQILRLRNEPGLAVTLAQGGLERARSEFDWKVLFEAHEAAMSVGFYALKVDVGIDVFARGD